MATANEVNPFLLTSTLNHSSNFDSHFTSSQPPLQPSIPLPLTTSPCYSPPGVEQVTSAFARDFILLLYIVTALLSLTSNGAVILVQLYGSESSRSIRKYLNSLAVSDIMLVFTTMPATYSSTVLGEWIYPGWFCRASRYFQILSSFVTSATLTIIGIERYVVTLHPLSRSCNWFQSHNRTLLLVSWAVGLAYSCLANTNELSQYSLDNVTYHYQCAVDQEAEQLALMQFFVVVHFLLSFILPLVAIIASYAAIMNKLKFNNSFIAQYFSGGGSGSSASGGDAQRGRAWICVKAKDETPNAAVVWPSISVDHRSKSIKMMLIVMVMYCICWAPIKLFQLLNYYALIPNCSELQYHRWIASYVAANWLAMANCFVNPLIYSFMSCNFRDDFRRICKSFWGLFARKRKENANV